MKSVYTVKKQNSSFCNNLVFINEKSEKYDYVIYCPSEFQDSFSFRNNVIFSKRPPLRMARFFLYWIWHMVILRKDYFVSKGLVDVD